MSPGAADASPSVSVVIPHYGDPRHALSLAADLRGQEASLVWQIIVVDDQSPTPFPKTTGVEVIRRERNGGFGAAVNTGAAEATGDWLLIANSDVRLGPTLMAQLIERAHPLMPAVVGPASVDEQGRPEHTGRRFPAARHLAVTTALPLQHFSRSRWMLRLAGYVLPRGNRPVRVDWLQGSLLLLPREVFASSGGFDESYYMYSEEVDLQRRLGDLGAPAWLLPDVTVTHVGGASTIGIVDVGEQMIKSRLLYASKFGGEQTARNTLRAVAVLNLACRLALRAVGRESAPRLAWHREWRRASLSPSAVSTTDATTERNG